MRREVFDPVNMQRFKNKFVFCEYNLIVLRYHRYEYYS